MNKSIPNLLCHVSSLSSLDSSDLSVTASPFMATGHLRLKRLKFSPARGKYFAIGGLASLSVLLAANVLWCSTVWAGNGVTGLPTNALPTTPTTTYGANIKTSTSIDGKSLTITQTAPTNIVTWNNFNIGSAAAVNIVQPSSSAVMLNKVIGSTPTSQTTINGMLNANGRVYIYDPNGVVFGKTAAVNVNTLIASSLKFDESRVIGGLVLPGTTPVLAADASTYAGGGSGPGYIVVEADALINSANGGMILLAAPMVINNGKLNATDGQVILAAGSKVYLTAPPGAQTYMRGLLVQVNNDSPVGNAFESKAENGATGAISVGQGNASLMGYAVNQNGLVSATTSVNLNGSIYLRAGNQSAIDAQDQKLDGPLKLGPNSVTEVLPLKDDTATVSATNISKFNPSRVELNGETIELQQNALIRAPGGNLTLSVEHRVSSQDVATLMNPASATAPRIDFAAGSQIDVSGSSLCNTNPLSCTSSIGTALTMESNVMTVNLRGTELADNLPLRNSALYGSDVRVDVRQGTSIANISGWFDLQQYTLGQLNAAGGTVNVTAKNGAIVQRPGSTINVDGGFVDYQAGYVNTTQLMQTNGTLVDVGSAQANTLYTSIVNLPDSPANFVAGYRQGSKAGSVSFSAPILSLQGLLSGKSTVGIWQRDVTAVDSRASNDNLSNTTIPINKIVYGYPKGGLIQVDNTVAAEYTGYAENIDLGAGSAQAVVPPDFGVVFESNSPILTGLNLNPLTLGTAGINRISATTSGNISVNNAVTLAAGGSVSLTTKTAPQQQSINAGGSIQISAPVIIPGGSLKASATNTLQLNDYVNISLAGLWTNDMPQSMPMLDSYGYPLTSLVLKGGTIDLSVTPPLSGSVSQLLLGNNVSMDVSAGAWLDNKAKLSQGTAGSIALQATPNTEMPVTPTSANGVLKGGTGLNLSAYGFSSGGKLTLKGQQVFIGTPTSTAVEQGMWLFPKLFQSGGFTNFDITANSDLSILDNTQVQPHALSWQLNSDMNFLGSGAMAKVASPFLFDLSGSATIRPATSVTLRANVCDSVVNVACGGSITVNAGASLVMDPGANLNVFAGRQLTVLGTLNAPAGHISLGLMPGAFASTRSIWFGPNAQVLAMGSLQRLYTNGMGISSGSVLNGGTIQIGGVENAPNGVLKAAAGYVVAEQGSVFNVSGIQASGLSFKSNGVITPGQDIASSGGSIEIRAYPGLLFDGILKGSGGGLGAGGGTLTVSLDTFGDPPILSGAPGNPNGQWQLTILPASTKVGSIVPNNLQPGQAILDSNNEFLVGSTKGVNAKYPEQGWISTNSFDGGGFGTVTLKSRDVLAFELGKTDLTLSARDALILDAPNLSASYATASKNSTLTNSLLLSAPYIQLGSADTHYQTPLASSYGVSLLTATATTIDLIGNSALQGFGTTNLNARADIRLVGLDSQTDVNGNDTGYTQGSLATVGSLTLTDAQTYPTSLSDFALLVNADPAVATTGKLIFTSNGNTPQPVLSAAGSLRAIAPQICQSGRLVAPFGSITLGNVDNSPLSAIWDSYYGTRISSPNNPLFFGSSTLDNLRIPNDPNVEVPPATYSQPIITTELLYQSDSVTSVAGAGIVPFGNVIDGSVPSATKWSYNVTYAVNPTITPILTQRALPAKAIISNAQNITAAANSLQDLSGGGALLAYEFTPGKTGSKDVLNSTTTFAISPSFKGSVAPLDNNSGSSGLKPGDSVYLSGMPGLAAGTYTLLPAHYALLPGTFTVTASANTANMQASSNTLLPDGSMLMAGHWTNSGSGTGSTASSGFIVSSSGEVAPTLNGVVVPGVLGSNINGKEVPTVNGIAVSNVKYDGWTISPTSVVGNKSQFSLYYASDYFTATAATAGVPAPDLPTDGGHIAFHATGSTSSALTLNSAINISAASGGRAGLADISAPQITVVSTSSQLADGSAIVLSADYLTALGADSLWLGGVRDTSNNTWSGNTQNLTLNNDAQHPLLGSSIVLMAINNLTLDSGAMLLGSGSLARSASFMTVEKGSALLRVSSSNAVAVTRTNPAEKTGKLNIASGATVGASGSANLDAPGGVTLNGTLNMASGSALSLGAPGMSLGSAIPTTDTHLKLGTDQLSKLSGLSSLTLNSYASNVNLYGTVNFGNANTRLLSFQGAGFKGDGGVVNFIADNVNIEGASGAVAPNSANALGSLSIKANTLAVGSNNFSLQGYNDVVLTASGELKATGSAGQLWVDHNLALAAALFDTSNAATASYVAGDSMTLSNSANSLSNAFIPGKGGQMSFKAKTITSDAQVVASSGKVTLLATKGIVDVNSGLISVAGDSVVFGNTTVYAPGGTISLSGSDMSLGQNASLNVSAVGAGAGTLSITAGATSFRGTLKGDAATGIDGKPQTQGQFVLDTLQAGTADQFGSLNKQLNEAGFTESRQFRFREGDVSLGSSDASLAQQIIAHQIVIAADNGNITISGTAVLDAAGVDGGSISLYATQTSASATSGKVILSENARLLANTSVTSISDAGLYGHGGQVILSTATADGSNLTSVNEGNSLNLAGGSIELGGVSGNGTLTLRAPRVGNQDVAIAPIGTAINNSSATVIEADQIYQASAIMGNSASCPNCNDFTNITGTILDATSTGNLYGDTFNFMAYQPDILGRLFATTGRPTNLSLNPGIEVQSGGNLTVSVNEFAANPVDRGWNLAPWRFGPDNAPVILTLRAAGNLNIVGSISDGFVKPGASITHTTSLLNNDPFTPGTPGTTTNTITSTTPATATAPATSITTTTTIVTTASRVTLTTVITTATAATAATFATTTTDSTTIDTTAAKVITTTATSAPHGGPALPDWQLGTGTSASYRFAGGADLAAANPMAVKPGSGDVKFNFADRTPPKTISSPTIVILSDPNGDDTPYTLTAMPWKSTDGLLNSTNLFPAVAANAPLSLTDAPVALVRTGTGNIQVAAGNNVSLGMAKSFVFNTAGNKYFANYDGTPVIATYKANDNTAAVPVISPNTNGSYTVGVEDSNTNAAATYDVKVFGAALYTAGQANTLPTGFVAPKNQLNVQYGAGSGTLTPATFGAGGGTISVDADGNVYGPQQLGNSYRLAGAAYVMATLADKSTGDPAIAETPAVANVAGDPATTVWQQTVPTLVNDWLFRQGRTYVDTEGKVQFEVLGNRTVLNTAWWSRYDYFNGGIATLGGGNVQINAASNIQNLSASVASNAIAPGTAPADLIENGGNSLQVHAGNNLMGGQYYVQNGAGTLRADASVTAGDYVPTATYLAAIATESLAPGAMNPVLALGNASLVVTAGANVAIESAYNPMLTEQNSYNRGGSVLPVLGTGGSSQGETMSWDVTTVSTDAEVLAAAIKYRQDYAQFSNFSTYGDHSSVSLIAAGGDMILSNAVEMLAVAGNNVSDVLSGTGLTTAFRSLYALMPSQLSAAALSGNLTSTNGFRLMPAAQGSLNLMAAGTIDLSNGGDSSAPEILMLDTNPAAFSSSSAPRVLASTDKSVIIGSASGISAHMIGGLHSDDRLNNPHPIEIVALNGDIIGNSAKAMTLSLPTFAEILAGRDIVNLGFTIQHNDPSDVSSVSAGRDFIENTILIKPADANDQIKNIVSGPGSIDFYAGRHIDFGNRGGLVTRGNLENAYLPEGGATINMITGAKPDYAKVVNWLTQYGSVKNVSTSPTTLTAAEQKDLIAYMQFVQPALPSDITPAAALSAFLLLSADQQKVFYTTHQSAANIIALESFVSKAESKNLTAYLQAKVPSLSSSLTPVEALTEFNSLTALQQAEYLIHYANNYDLLAFLNANIKTFSAVLQPGQVFIPATATLNAADIVSAISKNPTSAVTQLNQYLLKHTDILAVVGSFSSAENVWGAFRSLSATEQNTFLNAHPDVLKNLSDTAVQLGSELAVKDWSQLNAHYFTSMIEVSNQNNLGNFDQLIASLFPTAATATVAGNINVFSSQIKTEQGGAINMFTPTGSVYAGLTTGVNSQVRIPSTQGIFTIRGGGISAVVNNDFLVNQGRVFTLGGGDITLVSQYNNIDAGKGAKTASSAPPPQITMDANGKVVVDVSGSISGSGIATLKTNPLAAAGNVYLIAPRGIVDGGDAGVRSSGNISVKANVVLNSGNFAASGTNNAPPPPPALSSPPPPPPPSSAASSNDDATKSLNNASADNFNAALNVEVAGFGEEPNTPESKASEEAPAADSGNKEEEEKKKKNLKKKV